MGLRRLLPVAVLTAATACAGVTPWPLGLDVYRPVPASNPLTPERIALGRRLFHDPRLSRDGTISCASCHDPSRAFSDGRAIAVGAGGARGRRNTPAIVNRAWGQRFFWDGRASALESLVLEPLFSPIELGASPDRVIRLLRRQEYADAASRAFPGVSAVDAVARALASYVRTVLSGDAPVDRFLAGERSALTPAARRGMGLFTGRAACMSCHVGPTFTDEQFHNTGVAWRAPSGGAGAVPLDTPRDDGRFAVTRAPGDRGAFKTPTLREVARTAPYMHDGSIASLEAVIDFYDGGGQANPRLDHRIRPLGLSADEKTALVTFLHALSGNITEGRR